MKTSNKILIAATVVVLAWLIVFDMTLKAEYVKGDYNKPHYHMHQLGFSNFNIIEHNAGNIIGIRVEKGPYGVWMDDYLKDKITVSQHDKTLLIECTSKEDFGGNGVIITCPDLVAITTNPLIRPGNNPGGRYSRKSGTSLIIDYFPHATSTVTGFDQLSMTIVANEFTVIDMEKNTLGQLNAKVGDSKKGNAGVIITTNNKITFADFQVPGKSTLTLDNVVINKVTYKIADSADVHLTGKAVHLLDHQ